MTWGLLLVLLGVLDLRGQEGPIGIGTGAQVGYGFQHFLVYKKGDAKLRTSSKRRGSTGSGVSQVLRYWKEVRVVLSTDRGLVVLRFCKGDEELRGATVC